MSQVALSTIQDIIEKTVFERIRQEVVDKGYLPDISDTVTYPDTDAGYALWEAAIDAIVTAKGFAIEIFNGGISEARGVKKIPRIVINSGSFLPGALGGDPQRIFSDQGTEYAALVTPPQTVDYYLDIHLVSNRIVQARILNAILALAIPRRAYIPFYNSPTDSFFIRTINYYDADSSDEGIMEKVFGYEIPDLWDMGDMPANSVLTGDNVIAKMSEITLNTNVQKYMDRTWGIDSDPLIVT